MYAVARRTERRLAGEYRGSIQSALSHAVQFTVSVMGVVCVRALEPPVAAVTVTV